MTLAGIHIAEADEHRVELEINGALAFGDLVEPDGGAGYKGVLLITHGTLAHKDMEIIEALQSALAERGVASLAHTLTAIIKVGNPPGKTLWNICYHSPNGDFMIYIFELSYLFCVFGFVGYFLKRTSIAKPYLPVSAASASKVIQIKLFSEEFNSGFRKYDRAGSEMICSTPVHHFEALIKKSRGSHG